MKQFNSTDGWESTRLHQKHLLRGHSWQTRPKLAGWDVLFNRNCSILYHVLQSVLCPTEHNWGVGTRPIVERHPWSTGRNCSWCHHFCVFVFLCLCICICICICVLYCIDARHPWSPTAPPVITVIICFLITLSDSCWSTERMWSRVWITICGNHSIVFPVIGRGKHNWWPGDRRAWPEEGRGDATGMKPSTWQPGRQSLEAIQITTGWMFTC